MTANYLPAPSAQKVEIYFGKTHGGGLSCPAFHGNRHGVILPTQEIGHFQMPQNRHQVGDDPNHNVGIKVFHCGMRRKVGAVARKPH